ncbi:MAG TPA: peptidase S1 [Caulobacterales bacterium]|nr:peptidase S1 [Caulobacterales bacterium]
MSIKKFAAASAVILAATLGLSGASAQDWRQNPTFGTVNLRTGFEPDPHLVTLQSGGSIDASQTIGNGCAGFIANAPDVDLNFTAGSGANQLPLVISVNSNADTTLVVNGPDGKWYCDDDSGNGALNPSLTFTHPQSGLYDIYVGTYGGSSLQPATLSISEVSSQ